ncbi:MAG: YkgJ family cysteine cluster protein [Promethearchaeota archaeon]
MDNIAGCLKNGVKFKCLVPGDCDGHCCRGEGGIYIFPEDIRHLMESFEIDDVETFIDDYTKAEEEPCGIKDYKEWVPYLMIVEKEDGSCIFLNANGLCDAYRARPFQCRGFPFWEQNVKTERKWEKLKEFCPGAKRAEELEDSEYFPLSRVKELVKREHDLDVEWELAMIKWKNDYIGFLRDYFKKKKN